MKIDRVLTTDQVKTVISETIVNHQLSFDEENALYEFNRLSYEALNKKDNRLYWDVYFRVEIIVEAFSQFMIAANSYLTSFKTDLTAEIVKMVAEHVRFKIDNDR